MSRLTRLLQPDSIAVIGGGSWCRNVICEVRKFGFNGDIFPLHPKHNHIEGLAAYKSVADLPQAPDAAFIGVNREATLSIVKALTHIHAGGAVCFASGFMEAATEIEGAADLQEALVSAAGDMPILGPNCYGFINAVDQVAIWPDQHGAIAVDSGVAILTQSSNIAINMTMQKRGLPIAYMITVGNQAQTHMADVAMDLLQDERVTAIGLHIEGFGDLRKFEQLARAAHVAGKSIIALKIGKSDQAKESTVSHTASIAGSNAGATALLKRLGFGEVSDLATFLETLKILHMVGRLPSNRIASMSCSGGEAGLMADSAVDLNISYPPLNEAQKTDLRSALGPKVALANPLDYHTYIWADLEAMTNCFSAIMDPSLALGCVVLDFPRTDRCDARDWNLVINAASAAQVRRGVPMALIASLPENLSEDIANDIMSHGVIPLCGITEGLQAISIAAQLGQTNRISELPLLLPSGQQDFALLDEAKAKAALKKCGADIPKSICVDDAKSAASASSDIGFPVVLKGLGLAHKTEMGAVALDLNSAAEVNASATAMPTDTFLVEEMITDVIAELLVGVVRDPAHGFVLTIGAGGTLTEILKDTASLLLPVTQDEILQALENLNITPLLNGYRGKPGIYKPAIVEFVLALQTYVIENADKLSEVEVNPVLCTNTRAIVADALIRIGEEKAHE